MIVCARVREGWKPLVFAIVALLLFGSPGRAGNITGIVSFGDSLSDVGNTYLAAGIPASPPYFNGCYSNGPIWLDDLASKLGVGLITPSLAGGTDYAWGGANLFFR